jgi:hypothetical protein
VPSRNLAADPSSKGEAAWSTPGCLLHFSYTVIEVPSNLVNVKPLKGSLYVGR